MNDAPIPTPGRDTELGEALSDLVRAVETDLAAPGDAPVASPAEAFDAVLAAAKKLSPAGRAHLLYEIARGCGLTNLERAAWRVFMLHCEQEGRGSSA